MRQYEFNFDNSLIIDNFAGGGGASIGIEMGLNRPIDIAINHDPIALDVHKQNHPNTLHITSDVFEVDPIKVCCGRPVGFAWFSPDCKHFSKAKGGTPLEKNIRGLAWVTRRWAKLKRPKIIVLENVEEFLTWGPLKKIKGEWRPDKRRSGLTFNAFNSWFIRNGYQTEYRIIKACDLGAPTIRKRLYWIARCDGRSVVWPEQTHGPKNSILVKKRELKPYRETAECIDWSIPCPSIFMDKAQARSYKKRTGIQVKRPLADATLKRIAKGVVKFVLTNPNPFIVPIANYGGGSVVAQSINEPLRTITANPKGGAFALCTPFMVRQFGQSVGHSVKEPTGSITANGGGKEQLASVIAVPMISRQFGTGICHKIEQPLATIMSGGGGGKSQLVSAFLAKHYTGVIGSDLRGPIGTITSIDHHSVVTTTLSKSDIKKGSRVAAFLVKYYGQGIGCDINEPIHTITANDRFGLVTVTIQGEPWVIIDIGIRMLKPHELMKAQGFPDDYYLGDYSNTDKVRLIGNSVSPVVASAIAAANWIVQDIKRIDMQKTA